MKIAVTGGTGFLGRHTVPALGKTGHDVVVLGRCRRAIRSAFGDSAAGVETDYSLPSLVKALSGVDAVVHLAAALMERDTHPHKLSQFFDANLLLTENLYLAALENRVNRIRQSSSISVYSSKNRNPVRESEPPVPSNIYGVSKLACEHLADYLASRTDLRITNLRLARLFGPGERPGVVFMKCIDLARKKLPLPVWGRGETRIDYLYVKDAVSAILASLEPDAAEGTYNIGSGQSFSVREIAETVNAVYGNPGNIAFDLSKAETASCVVMDCTKAKKLMKWSPIWTLEEAVRDMLSRER